MKREKLLQLVKDVVRKLQKPQPNYQAKPNGTALVLLPQEEDDLAEWEQRLASNPPVRLECIPGYGEHLYVAVDASDSKNYVLCGMPNLQDVLTFIRANELRIVMQPTRGSDGDSSGNTYLQFITYGSNRLRHVWN